MDNERERKREEQRYRHLKRWWNSLPPEKRRSLTVEEMADLILGGLVDEHGDLTPAGELELHNLETREWMVKHPRRKGAER